MPQDKFTFFIIPEVQDPEFKNPKRYKVFRKYDYEVLVAIVSYDWEGTGFRIRFENDLTELEKDQLISEAKTLGRWLFKPDL